MKYIQIDQCDSYQIWRALYLINQCNLLKVYCERQGWQLPSTLKETHTDSCEILSHSIASLKERFVELNVPNCSITVELDTGRIQIDEKGSGTNWTTSRLYGHSDLMSMLFPDIVVDKVQCLTFYLTDICNLRCTYCYEKNNVPKTISTKVIDEFLHGVFENKYKNSAKFEACVLQFIGGEPLLYPSLIHYTIDKYIVLCIEHGRTDLLLFSAFSTTTNGVTYTDPTVQNLLHVFPSLQVAISLDGCKEAHDKNRHYANGKGSWRYAVQASRSELLRNNNFTPKMTYNKDTIEYLCKSLKYIKSLNANHVTCTPALEEKYTLSDAKDYLTQLKCYADFIIENNLPDYANLLILDRCDVGREISCGGQGLGLAVFPDGKVYTCQRFAKNNCSCDNALDLSLNKKSTATKVLSQLRKCATKYAAECESCPLKSKCNHCAAIDYNQTGNLSEYKSTNGCLLYWAQAIAGDYYTTRTGHGSWLLSVLHDICIDNLPNDVVELLRLEVL